MQISAIFAMGRTCDPRWQDIVLEELDNDDHEIQFEAARACGEIEIAAGVPALGKLFTMGDHQIKEMAVWALGEIGSQEALELLDAIARTLNDDDDDLQEAVEDAIAEGTFKSSMSHLEFDLDV